jgi:hypothetical protein
MKYSNIVNAQRYLSKRRIEGLDILFLLGTADGPSFALLLVRLAPCAVSTGSSTVEACNAVLIIHSPALFDRMNTMPACGKLKA